MSLTENNIKLNHSRFSDAPWYGKSKDIIIGGAGGTGSWSALFLSRIGHKLIVFDMDSVDRTNMAGQCYFESHIGNLKTTAVADICSQFSGESIDQNGEYTRESIASEIMIACFDSMKARKTMFNRWMELIDYHKREETYNESEFIFIDLRMEAETGQIYFVTPDKIDRYKETLFEDDEVADLACSFKATTHNGAMIASQMVSGLNNHISNNVAGFEYREVPFSMKYMLELLTFNIER